MGDDAAVVAAAGRIGIDVVVVQDHAPQGDPDDVPGAVVPRGIRRVIVDDTADVGRICAALERAGQLREPFDAVTTSREFCLVTAAVIAKLLGVRGHDPRTVLHYRDKALQKRRVRAAGIPTTRAFVIDDIRRPGDLSHIDFETAVVKPIAGASSQHTLRVRSGDLPGVLADLARQPGCPRTFLVEEFVFGDEWHSDGIVFDGEVRFVSLTRYGSPCLGAVIRRDITLDPVDDHFAYERVVPTVEAALGALGLLDGVFHMELFVDDRAVTFGECAARRGGGVQEYVELKHGVDLTTAALQACVGWEPSIEVVRNPRVVGSIILPLPPGTVVAAPTVDEIEAQDGVEMAQVYRSVGFVTPTEPPLRTFAMATAWMTAPDAERLESGFDDLLAWCRQQVRVRPHDAATPT